MQLSNNFVIVSFFGVGPEGNIKEIMPPLIQQALQHLKFSLTREA